MLALSILRQVEAQLYTHEVKMMTYRAEMVVHQHDQQHGSTTAVRAQIAAHNVCGTHHAECACRHAELMEATFALDRLFTQTPQP